MENLKPRPANSSPLTPIGFIERTALIYGDSPSIIYNSTTYTWSETHRRCLQLASSLSSIGIQRGHVVSVIAPNTPAMYELHFAVPMVGAVLNTINLRLDPRTISVLLRHSETKLIFVDQASCALISDALALFPSETKRPLLVLIADDTAVQDSSLSSSVLGKLKDNKKQERKRSLRQLLSFRQKQEARVAARKQEEEVTRVRRQRRARMRKEWQRKLDVEGRMYWFRASFGRPATLATDARSTLLTKGYVLQVEKKRIVSVIEEMDKDERLSTTETLPASPRVSEAVSEPRTAAERTKSLRNACEGVQFDLVDSAAADPTRLPTVQTPLSDAQKKDIVAQFKRDFPSKYAQFVTSSAGLLIPAEVAHLRLNVNRKRVYEESIASFAVIHREHMRSVMRINFLEENGIDAGGLHREWFALFVEKIVDPATGLFVCVDRTEQTYYINPNSHRDVGEHHLMHYFATGRLLGRALMEGYATGFHLALPLLKIILGVPVSFSDMEFFDPETYKSMMWILENDGVEHLGLDFSISEQRPGTTEFEIVDLIPDGRNIAVNDENKMEFLERKFKYMIFESVESQLYALLTGIYEVIPQEMLMVFDPEEFDHVLCGSDEIDVDDWENNTLFSDDLHEHSALKWFWEIVREMPNEYRRRLLLFATGSSRVPLAGFSALTSYDGKLCPFTLKGVPLVNDGYVVGHACFNRIDLPRHESKDDLRTVLYATLDCEQYGFTTE